MERVDMQKEALMRLFLFDEPSTKPFRNVD